MSAVDEPDKSEVGPDVPDRDNDTAPMLADPDADSAVPDAVSAGPAGRPARPWVRVAEGLIGLGIVVLIFVGVFPQFANYSQAWSAIGAMDWWWWSAIVVAAVFNLVSYVWPYQAVLPGLRFGDGFIETETTAAISNTVPVGGAVALGMTYRMFGSFGFTPVAISAAVVATGLLNQAVKLGLPILAVIALAVTGQSTAGLVGLAVFGFLLLAAAGVLVWLVFRSERGAHAVGHLMDRCWGWLRRVFRRSPATSADRIERAVLRFRDRTIAVVADHARRLSHRLPSAPMTSSVL